MKDDSQSMLSDEHFPSSQEMQTKDALALCDHLMQDFKDRADRHKRTFKRLRYTSVALATAVTIVSTLAAIREISLWIVPIVSGLSVLSALCTTLLSANNSQERWVHSRGVQQQLEAERFLYLQRAGGYATPDEEANIHLFSERVVVIWSEAQQGWAQGVVKVSYGLSSSSSKESKL